MNKKWAFALVTYTLLLLMTGTNLPTPLYNVYQKHWHFSPSTLTLVFSTYALVLIPMLFLFGKASDRLGRKRTLLIGVGAALVGSALLMEASGTGWLFAARVFQGIGIAMSSGAASAALADLNDFSPPRVSALAASVAPAAGTALGPLFSGVIAQYGPDPLSLPYGVHIALLLPCLLAIPFMHETVKTDRIKKRSASGMKIPHPSLFMLVAFASFVSWAVTAMFISVAPSYITSLMHVTNLAVLGGIVFLMPACSTFTQLISRKMPYAQSITYGLVLLIAGLGSLVAAVPLRSMALILAATIVSGIGQGLSFMGSVAVVNELSPANIRGQLFSLYYAIVYLGVGVPVIGIGMLATQLGWYTAVVAFATVILLAGIPLIFLLKYKWPYPKSRSHPIQEVQQR